VSASPVRSEIPVHPAKYQRGWSKHRFPGPGYHLSVGSVGSAWRLGSAHVAPRNSRNAAKAWQNGKCRPHSSKFIPLIKCHSGNNLRNMQFQSYPIHNQCIHCIPMCSALLQVWGHLGPGPTVKPAEELTPSISTFARTRFTRKSSELLKNLFTATVLRQVLLTESNESLNFGCRVRPWIRMD